MAEKWNGKLYKPVKFGEGSQPGTVEWEQEKRRKAKLARQAREELARVAVPERKGWLARLFGRFD